MERASGRYLMNNLDHVKHSRGYKSDTELTVDELKKLVDEYKNGKEIVGETISEDPGNKCKGGIGAVFSSWNGKGRGIPSYRKIPDEWGTAVNAGYGVWQYG